MTSLIFQSRATSLHRSSQGGIAPECPSFLDWKVKMNHPIALFVSYPLFSRIPASFVHRFQRISNWAARLILKTTTTKKTGKSDHIIPLFQSLHWLPVSHRMQYKLNTPCYNCLSRSAPPYFCYCLQLYAPFRTLRSAPDTISAFGSLVADFPLLVLLPFPSLDLYQE